MSRGREEGFKWNTFIPTLRPLRVGVMNLTISRGLHFILNKRKSHAGDNLLGLPWSAVAEIAFVRPFARLLFHAPSEVFQIWLPPYKTSHFSLPHSCIKGSTKFFNRFNFFEMFTFRGRFTFFLPFNNYMHKKQNDIQRHTCSGQQWWGCSLGTATYWLLQSSPA